MRYRLRTLMILMAVGPVVIYYFAMRHIESADSIEQLKDRKTRIMLEPVRAKMDQWIRLWKSNPPSDDEILSQWKRLLTDDNGRPMRDAWGRPFAIGWRGFNENDLYAKSSGIDGIHDGFWDANGDDIVIHLWLPMYGLKRSNSPEPDEPPP